MTPQTNQKAKPRGLKGVNYKWIALSNTTLGVLMASINGNIILISLPAIFNGMGMNPLSPDGASYMLWMLMGFSVVTATLLVSFGRISDIFGRVKLYNLGFAIFTISSILLFFTPGTGATGIGIMIVFRILQGIGSGFLFSNSTAIITDAFSANERGTAMGINQIFAVGGTLLGLILGGVLSAVDWRLVFLVSVPFGLLGTIWAYLKLKEQSKPDKTQKIDWLGNGVFAVGLTALLLALTYGIMPYGASNMGWSNPWVIAGIVGGLALLVAFCFIETRVKMPMFHLQLFRIRSFAFGNISLFLSSIARGGLQFMLIIWLQGIWLPLHGFSFESTPLWAGIYMLPMTAGFFVMGPLSGRLSDRYGARFFSTGGMVLTVIGFILLNTLPSNFGYGIFAFILVILGIGMGMFAAPNTMAIMNSVPPAQRGVTAGMRATFQNTGSALSMTLYFAILIVGLASKLPPILGNSLMSAGVPAAAAEKIAQMPPTGALFAAFLGYNPMGSLLGPDVLASLPAATQTTLLGNTFFPNAIAPAVMSSLHLAFYVSAVISAVAAVASFLRGKRYVHGEDNGTPAPAPKAAVSGDAAK
ncbi:Predicted arabinose efflux permease, MFS family [Sporobacter termitidis DSM 10068]|uniref:Predicted arabinose efflux permease, MFS family n=1 Tax=Sporobacter termitidis DSM 10068 TaxID=1123282 RepID=A0A1M5TAN3_9FIRM|nr:MFS transporter [Sporobacter termitidis]SHH47736.1 Predicted arabinose efflux permease, MFS family [Sporobacter termitidis DSM 10068]